MSYPLDKELRVISWQKPPMNLKLYPIMNVIMKIFKCKSDEKVNVTVHKTHGYENVELNTYVIEPKKSNNHMPCLVFFHGGGFMIKASGAHYKIAKEYAEKLPCKVVYVDYRLAPKHPFPIPVEDCFETYQWVLDNVDMLGIDKSRIVIGGDSVGGNLATAVTLMARDRRMQLPIAALLIYPAIDRRMITESMKKYTDTPVWDARLNQMMWNAYLNGQMPEHIEYASPIEATSFENFPESYIEVAEYDCLRDEGIMLSERLKEEGVGVELHEVKNACHGFETATDSSITKECMNRRIQWLKKIMMLCR